MTLRGAGPKLLCPLRPVRGGGLLVAPSWCTRRHATRLMRSLEDRSAWEKVVKRRRRGGEGGASVEAVPACTEAMWGPGVAGPASPGRRLQTRAVLHVAPLRGLGTLQEGLCGARSLGRIRPVGSMAFFLPPALFVSHGHEGRVVKGRGGRHLHCNH